MRYLEFYECSCSQFYIFQDGDSEKVPTLAAIPECQFVVNKENSFLKTMSHKSMIIPGPDFFHSPQLSNSNKVIIYIESPISYQSYHRNRKPRN